MFGPKVLTMTEFMARQIQSRALQRLNTQIWLTAFPKIAKKARQELDQNGLQDVRVAIYMISGKLALSSSSILTFHKSVHDDNDTSRILQEWIQDGWCGGSWGITSEEQSIIPLTTTLSMKSRNFQTH